MTYFYITQYFINSYNAFEDQCHQFINKSSDSYSNTDINSIINNNRNPQIIGSLSIENFLNQSIKEKKNLGTVNNGTIEKNEDYIS